MDKYSYISNADTGYIDELYKAYRENPESVDLSWRRFFEGFDFHSQNNGDAITPVNGKSALTGADSEITSKELGVRNIIHAYRTRGHLKSLTNPIRPRRKHKVFLDLEDHGLSESDLDTELDVGNIIGIGRASVRSIIETLQKVYLGPIGFEYMHIRDPEIIEWFKQKAENDFLHWNPEIDTKKRILSKLNEAVVFENFLHTKYIGQKRFSLEGGENTIPALDRIICRASELGVREVVIGMAHRGRLNVLANVMGKTYDEIFNEFEGTAIPDMTMGDGDVKYHLGYSSDITTHCGNHIYLKLTPNPSHLEAVDPVVLGYARAQIDEEYNGQLSAALPILIHGDAAIAGQGIVYEITQMANLPGYRTGGAIHFVINNQVGFTTDYDDARSSIYCTDIGKIIDAPVLHVNGDDAEAVDFAANLAIEFRQKFGKDIYIDLLCYRRHGHNESDEPKFTQPILYNLIAKHPNPREVYSKMLIDRGDVDAELAVTLDKEFRDLLQDRLNQVKQNPLPYKPQKLDEEWHHLRRPKPEDFIKSPATGISEKQIEKIAMALTSLPKGFKPIRQIDKLIKERKNDFFDKKQLNWADAELLAYGSILIEGKAVRMSGQDVKRGTFSHRHAVVFDADTNQPYCQLDNIEEGQNHFRIYNSLLSEFGVLGFEYGYALASPNTLVLWEAQFGDFVNGAQVMLDQFIVSAATKWQKMNGLVMLLPHGYEGQGPEHSSARPERFLQTAADVNMVIANITTPANFFHLLRRQLEWEFRIPCVVMSPKSLLRHPEVVSDLDEFTNGSFRELIHDDYAEAAKVKKVLLCTGKLFYELRAEQKKSERKDVAIIRIEQLFPFPEKQLNDLLSQYKKARVWWVQEEPENMGYWTYMLRVYRSKIFDGIYRKPSSSPATGFAKVHQKEQEEIIKKAFQ
ncbi:MAG: 2-oxoglutarate dehydrogenase E1 component [Cyclobacteriaceae bacterium]|nr:2-oxoglutarate dehydrogenase E1 component [Cyclobacteriaceae bacterium]